MIFIKQVIFLNQSTTYLNGGALKWHQFPAFPNPNSNQSGNGKGSGTSIWRGSVTPEVLKKWSA